MRWQSIAFAALLAVPAARAEAPSDAPQPVWAKTKIVVCEVLSVHNCRTGGCEAAPKLPSFRIDIGKQVMCAVVSGGCKSELKVGQVGLDRGNTRLTLHTLGAAFVVGVDADGTMNGADVVKGRVVTIQGRCVPG